MNRSFSILGRLSKGPVVRQPKMAEQAQLNKKSESNFIKSGFIAFLLTAVLMHLWPQVTQPFTLFGLWSSNGTISEWLWTSRWVFAWGIGFTVLVSILTRNKPEENRAAEKNLVNGFIISVIAGVTEEIVFRWIFFLFSMYVSVALNWLFLGFIGLDLLAWLQIYILGPVANFFTLGLMEDKLTNPALWVIGSGIITANSLFRDGHKYLGPIGFINSWFIGMFFFYLMFQYGLPAAILVHFLYDLGIFVVRYIDQALERSGGNA